MEAGQRQPRPWRFAVLMVAAAVGALFIAGCGGKPSVDVDLTKEPPVEVRWEIELLRLCDGTAEERVAELNRVNNEHLNRMFLLVACPGADPLNTDAKAILYNGVPAMAIQAQVFYLFPGMGEQAKTNNGGGEPSAPTEYAGVCRGQGNRIAPTPC